MPKYYECPNCYLDTENKLKKNEFWSKTFTKKQIYRSRLQTSKTRSLNNATMAP